MREEKKKLLEEIDRRVHEVAGEKGHLTFEEFGGLAKEFFGEFPHNKNWKFDEDQYPVEDSEDTASSSENETSDADDLPF